MSSDRISRGGGVTAIGSKKEGLLFVAHNNAEPVLTPLLISPSAGQ